MTLTLRRNKGSALTYDEMDDNFAYVANNASLETVLSIGNTANNNIAISGTLQSANVVTTSITINGDAFFNGAIDERVFTLSGTTSISLDPSNGTIQVHTLTGATTYTDNLVAGESITLMIDDGAGFTITWPTISWINNLRAAPTLATTGFTVVTLWKVDTTLYGALVGNGT
jgi:hypothetical protein